MYEKWLNEDFHVFRIEAKKIENYLLRQVRRERLNVLVGGSERVALKICRKYEATADAGVGVLCMGRREFGETTGLSERTVTRILADFEERNFISRKGWDVIVTGEQYQKIKNLMNKRVSSAEEYK